MPPDSPLGKLSVLGQQLADKWRWTLVEAVLFVLTDEPPEISPITGQSEVAHNYSVVMWGGYDVFSRVRIDLDPAVTPQQLAGWWRDVRRRMHDERYRSQSKKHLRLAAFMAGRDETTSWDQDRLDWNRVTADTPEWNYADRRTFHRDATAAVERLLYVGFTAPKPRTESLPENGSEG